MRTRIGTVLAVLSAFAGSAFAIGPAAASTINYQITFAAGSFDPSPAAPTPDIALGQVNIALDTSVDTLTSQTAGITLNFLNLTLDSAVSYTYVKALDQLIVGGLSRGAASVVVADNDFALLITGIAHGTPSFVTLDFADTKKIFTAGTGTVHVSPVAATPIPAALPLFVSALGGLGLVGWRRRSA